MLFEVYSVTRKTKIYTFEFAINGLVGNEDAASLHTLFNNESLSLYNKYINIENFHHTDCTIRKIYAEEYKSLEVVNFDKVVKQIETDHPELFI